MTTPSLSFSGRVAATLAAVSLGSSLLAAPAVAAPDNTFTIKDKVGDGDPGADILKVVGTVGNSGRLRTLAVHVDRLNATGYLKWRGEVYRDDRFRVGVEREPGTTIVYPERKEIDYEDSYVGPWEDFYECGIDAKWNRKADVVTIRFPSACDVYALEHKVSYGPLGGRDKVRGFAELG